jgi:mannose-6-phosphate isomerase-like protein (cupin superfamily)
MDGSKNFNVIHNAFSDLDDKESLGIKGKFFAGQELNLTGCEVSINRLPAGTSFPFVHAHKMNEELYVIISGKGIFCVDNENFPIQEGSLIRVAPAGERIIKAEEELFYLCIQAENNSLTQSSINDGLIIESNSQK